MNKLALKLRRNSGFTIIEVALVLAIAGLIFLVVFLALPALQNSQKDTAARQMVGQIASSVRNYQADNGGAMPVTAADIANCGTFFVWVPSVFLNYLDRQSKSAGISFQLNRTRYGVGTIYHVDIYVDNGCVTPGNTTLAVKPGSYAIVTKLSGGNYYCQDI